MSQLAISSFSLFSKLGPLRLYMRDESGDRQVFEMPMPQETTIEEFSQKVADDLGVRAIEICQLQLEDDADRVSRLSAALREAGVSVLTVPIDIGSLSDATGPHLEEDLRDIEHWFDIAHQLGAQFVRVNVGLSHDRAGAEDREALIESLRSLSTSASSRGMRLLVENHGGVSSDPEYLISLRQEVGSERLGILLDLGNFPPLQQISQARMTGVPVDDTIDTESVYDRIAQLAPHATLVHAKAYDPRADGSPLLDIERALAIVADSGYSGNISVEWEGVLGDPWEGTKATADAVRRAFPAL